MNCFSPTYRNRRENPLYPTRSEYFYIEIIIEYLGSQYQVIDSWVSEEKMPIIYLSIYLYT